MICVKLFLHDARVRKHTDMRVLHAKRAQFSHVRMFSGSRNVQKRATKSYTSGHCLLSSLSITPQTVGPICTVNTIMGEEASLLGVLA